MRRKALLIGVVASLGLPAGALADDVASATSGGPGRDPVVARWNQELLHIAGTPGAQPPTIHPTRNFAIVHVAIYDAVQAITRSHEPYALRIAAPRRANVAAAVDAAAHDTLVALYPGQASDIDARFAAEVETQPSDTRTGQGLAAGQAVARGILALRADDGADATPPAYVTTGTPGDYRPAPAGFASPVFTHWPGVTPFGLRRADQFRPDPPPPLSGRRYADALNEVKDLGSATSATRTPDQTQIARFWNAPIQNYWNEIAQTVTTVDALNIDQQARLFAALDVTLADATIAFYDAKYAYRLWRPITAIRGADSDGNPATAADPAWTPLSSTPADPSYPGAHSVVSAAAATSLDTVLGSDRFDLSVTSAVLPGVTRAFAGFQAAAHEAGLSRIYAGVHSSLDHTAGLELGHDVSRWVLDHAFRGPGDRSPADALGAQR